MVMITVRPRKYLAQGNRIVQDFGSNYVIKFGCPESVRSGGQNRVEAATWARIKNVLNILDYVMPVLDAAPDGSWLIMEKARLIGNGDGPDWDAGEKLRRFLGNLGLKVADCRGRNLAYNSRGTLVAVDYGYSDEFCWDQTQCGTCEWCRLVGIGG